MNETVLVTGASGCVGSNLSIRLLELGFRVRALHRTASNNLTLDDLDVEHWIGDVRDKEYLRRAMADCRYVFHTAAIVAFWKQKHAEQLEVNVTGTRNVVDLCLELGVEKLVHTSSVAALGTRTDGKLMDETTEFNWPHRSGYKYSKYQSELEVLKGAQRGLLTTIVNPTVIIGSRDVRFHGGQIVRDIVQARVPLYVEGGMNVVSVNDVVEGHIAALERGRSGERYILGGFNMTFKNIFDLAAKVLNGTAPSIRVPVWSARLMGKIFDAVGTITRRQPWITSELLASIGLNHWYSIEKAKRELAYVPTAIEPAFAEAYNWYKEKGLL